LHQPQLKRLKRTAQENRTNGADQVEEATPLSALEVESMLRTLSCFHRWRLSSAKRNFARQLQSILGEMQHDEDAMQVRLAPPPLGGLRSSTSPPLHSFSLSLGAHSHFG
jgi:hypothetical protein